MRLFLSIGAAVAAVASVSPASADVRADGYLVFKTVRGTSLVEHRAESGHVVETASPVVGAPATLDPCRDPSFVTVGVRWTKFERFSVNVASTPAYLDPSEAARDIVSAHEAWEKPFTTDCPGLTPKSKYRAKYGGVTNRQASLVADLRGDGVNAVAFQSLAGTVCDGAAACVVLAVADGRILEADMALEERLTRYGFADYWTTADRTAWDDVGGQWAVSDTATHEFGHWAGLGHTRGSPALTMFPFMHDGAQTLGLGDLLGIAELY